MTVAITQTSALAVTSSFGWLDTDAEQRRKMLEVVDLFKDEGTVDELGTGTIRDALSDALFPGTSVLHTRLRYVLFVPWLMRRAADEQAPAEMAAAFRRHEYRLIESLLEGGENQGVIGNRARRALKRLPSAAYWAALRSWKLLDEPVSPDGFFRRLNDHRALARRTPSADDTEARARFPGTGLDPYLPVAPAGLLSAVTFDLTPQEEQYLSDRIATATQGSLFAWLIRKEASDLPDHMWDPEMLAEAPSHLAELVEHARRFHVAAHGAALVYNLLLAERADQEAWVDDYRARLEDWRGEVDETEALVDWDRGDWWAVVRRTRPSLRSVTQRFVDTWLDLLDSGTDVAESNDARSLVETRERQIKGGRARLANQAALDRWQGSSGLSRLDYRWSVARSHLSDLYRARGSA